MKHKGFTFIELLLVVTCIAILVTGAGFSFKRAKTSHMADTFAQELVILKTAIETYYESHDSLPELGNVKLSSCEKLKPFWKPFNSDSSNVLADTCWHGNISATLSEVYLQLYRYTINNGKRTNNTTPVEFSPAEIEILQKRMESICKFDKLNGQYVCYIFQEPIISESTQTPSTPSE